MTKRRASATDIKAVLNLLAEQLPFLGEDSDATPEQTLNVIAFLERELASRGVRYSALGDNG